MKKIYMIPTINVVKIQPQQMIAESATAGFGEGQKSGGLAASRRGSDWDDEDWDDEDY